MKRLDLLKQELETVSKLKTLSFDLMESCKAWYRNEIEAIEKWGSANPTIENNEKWSSDPEDLTRFLDQITRRVTEDNNDFIFETIIPFCEEIIHGKVSKRDLEEALTMWAEAKGKE